MKKITLAFCILHFAFCISYSQPGSLDNTFGIGGMVTTPVGSFNDIGNSTAIQNDGKIVVAGASDNGLNLDFAVVRYNSDGSLDNTFDTDGKVTTVVGSSDDFGSSAAIQSDGKIVVAGSSYNGSDFDFALVRYNSDGSLDNTFDTDGKVTTAIGSSYDEGNSAAIQNDGKIVVAGWSGNGANSDFALVRYNSDGSLDNAFGSGGIVTTPVGNSSDFGNSVTIQSDGKIVMAGSGNNGSNRDFALVRYNSDGSLDNTFGTGGIVTTDFGNSFEQSRSVAIQTDGKIVVAGESVNGPDVNFALARYNSDGSLDNTFDTDGKVTTDVGSSDDFGSSVAIQSDGKIVVAGSSYNGSNDDFALVRYNSDGSLDNTFDTDGKVTTDVGSSGNIGYSAVIQSDGKIVVAGMSSNGLYWDFAVARYNGDGSSGIKENTAMSDVNIYPNPTSGIFVIARPALSGTKLPIAIGTHIEIYNLLGENIFQSSTLNPQSLIDISHSPKGMYFIKIYDGVSFYNEKIITQ